MSLKYGLFLSQGFAQELAGIKDPVEAYETLTRWAQQELVIHFSDFSDATHLDAVRRFAKTFIA